MKLASDFDDFHLVDSATGDVNASLRGGYPVSINWGRATVTPLIVINNIPQISVLEPYLSLRV
jgi:hypothetical protein